jgi:hypothetical protein
VPSFRTSGLDAKSSATSICLLGLNCPIWMEILCSVMCEFFFRVTELGQNRFCFLDI